MRIPVVLDIESLPDPLGPNADDGEAPATTKDPEKRAEYKAKNQRKDWLKSSLDPMRNLVCIVGLTQWGCPAESFVIGTEPVPEGWAGPEPKWDRYNEYRLLQRVDERLAQIDERCLVTFNGKGFDHIVLALKAAAYGLARLARANVPKHKTHIDVMDAWAMGRWPKWQGTQEEIAKFLGIEVKPGLTGDRIWEAWQLRAVDKVVDKNLTDMKVLEQIAVRLDACGIIELGV